MTRSRFSGDRGGAVKVILIILGAFLVIAVGLGIYAATHWRAWAADIASKATESIIKESGIPESDQAAILVEVRQFGEEFKAGRVSAEDIARVAKEISEGPLLPMAGVLVAQKAFIEPSDMNFQEKSGANRTLQRFARGVYEKKISKDTVEQVVQPVAERKGNGQWRMKEQVTRMELDQFLANAKSRADEADIPDEPFEVNIAAELRKAIHGSDKPDGTY